MQAAIEEAVPAEVLTAALYARFRSRQDHTFAEKVLSAMRKGFGGHVESRIGSRASRDDGMTGEPPLVLVLMGVSGCGKSTVGARLSQAARLAVPRRRQLPSAGQHRQDEPGPCPLTDEDRWPWLAAIAAWIDERLRQHAGPASSPARR